MRHYLSFASLLLAVVLLFSACNNTPDHVKFIPKDASFVLGINTGSISKKVAWNILTGSELFKDLKAQNPNDSALMDFQNMGVDLMSTSYLYVKTDKRYQSNAKVTALIPLNNPAKWEAFVKKAQPNAIIKEQNKRKTIMGASFYAAWTDDMLVIMNPVFKQTEDNGALMNQYMEMLNSGKADSVQLDSIMTAMRMAMEPQMDEAMTMSEMDNAFNISQENSLADNKNFNKLQGEKHDISLWVNYENLGSAMGAMTGGITLAPGMLKDAALAAGIDFEKGKITSDMRYYVSEELKAVWQKADKSVDKTLVDMMPAQNLNLIMSAHIAPEALKGTLEKMGMLGVINMQLSETGMDLPYILGAFSGDMALTVTNFTLKNEVHPADSMYGIPEYSSQEPSANVTYALKIGKKENFAMVMQMLVSMGGLQAQGANTFVAPGGKGVTISYNDQYAVVVTEAPMAASFLQGSFKGQKMPHEASNEVYGHPAGLFIDVQSIFKGIPADPSRSADDQALLTNLQGLLKNLTASGGEYKGGAFAYHAELNFMNSNENSLLLLIDFANKMKKVQDQIAMAKR